MSDRLAEQLQLLAGQWQILEKQVTVNTAPPAVQLCIANPLRWGVIISQIFQQNVNQFTLAISAKAGFDQTGGWCISSGNLPLMLNVRQWGGLPMGELYALSSAANTILTVQEILMVQ